MKRNPAMNGFFKVALSTAKYSALFLFGVAVAIAIALAFGAISVGHLVMLFLWECVWRIALLLSGLWTAGMLVESMR